MSELDDIIGQLQRLPTNKMLTVHLAREYKAQAKQNIKDLMLGLMDEAIKGAYSGSQAIERFKERVKAL